MAVAGSIKSLKFYKICRGLTNVALRIELFNDRILLWTHRRRRVLKWRFGLIEKNDVIFYHYF